jgi:tRNA-2-methylthio-N6-dimethylallyladenosine synthase
MKRVYIETYGCQMNEYDSEIIKTILRQSGYHITETPDNADILLMNTCSVRENANRKIVARVHEFRHAFQENDKQIGILGCMVTNLGEDLLDLPINFMAGPDSYKFLPGLIEKAKKDKLVHKKLSRTETYADIYPTRVEGINAWIAVMRGCNNFCSFCVVPYARGRERSRTIPDIVAETEQLVQEGFIQVTLLGQNVNSYDDQGKNFADLLQAVSQVRGLQRIRFTSPHPKDFPLELIEVIADNAKICNHIHLPLQAGSDRILRLMRRTYTQKQYMALVDKIRSKMPNVTLSTDIIVGFPTETWQDYLQTQAVVNTVGFDSAFIFKYSERKGTLAAKKYADDVPEEEKTRRIVRLNDIQKNISLKKNLAHVNEFQTIIIEQLGTKKSPDDCQGRNQGNKLVILPGKHHVGEIVQAKITDATAHVLKAIPAQ